jgi:hypothetical protein
MFSNLHVVGVVVLMSVAVFGQQWPILAYPAQHGIKAKQPVTDSCESAVSDGIINDILAFY